METERDVTRVLVVDDEESQRTALASMIKLWGYSVETAADGQEALDKLATFDAHVIVTDLNMPRMSGQELLKRLKEDGDAPPVIVQTAYGSLETSVSMVHDLGAFWFLEKPVQSQALRLLLERAATHEKLAEHAERLERQLSNQGVLGEMVGSSPKMREVFALIQQVAPSRAAVLITGESGTGKELAARAIHALSPRRGGPFVALNCAAMPDSLMESELFGHEKGAFTGAVDRRAGCFELAQNGTVLLDEIGDMPVALQAKLLRVLEDSRVRRLGGKTEIQLDVRILASTNSPLEVAIREGKFREDLFYRLNVFPIPLPPLRDRKDDLPSLAAALLSDLNRKHGTKVTDVSKDVMERFRAYNWPGNVRELRNVVERAVILAGEGTILPSHLSASFGGSSSHALASPAVATSSGEELRIPVGSTIEQAERALIELTLEHTRHNKTRAAEVLGISQKTLFNKLKEYGAQTAGA
ncbi:MAG TPA: sigma-54 dependent transcriptional regulator [Bryobacteraceae bacterium]|jgi:DNA-binding NtrC family response regulator|nr:sigma-54 dependent transcriptional regulator [Bryobacteraceae bacterium]